MQPPQDLSNKEDKEVVVVVLSNSSRVRYDNTFYITKAIAPTTSAPIIATLAPNPAAAPELEAVGVGLLVVLVVLEDSVVFVDSVVLVVVVVEFAGSSLSEAVVMVPTSVPPTGPSEVGPMASLPLDAVW